MNAEIDTTKYKIDSQGRLVPIEAIKDIDLARDDIVREIVEGALALGHQVAAFKGKALDDIQAFTVLSAEKYGADLGGAKGNLVLTSFDGRYKIIRAVASALEFDERLQAAKALIDELLAVWSEGAKPELRTLVTDAFSTDRKGQIATHKILSLRRLSFKDQRWANAMQAINDAISVTGSKTYIRFYERDSDGKYRQISLDPTDLQGK